MPPRLVRSFDGTPIAVHDLGGSGRPALFVPGAGLVAAMFRPLARALAGELSCLGIDPRGHGRSGFPKDEHLHWHEFAADVLAVVDELGLESPIGVGHSMGGGILLLAELARPGTFRELYLFEPVAATPLQQATIIATNPLIELSLRRRGSFPSRAQAASHLRLRAPYSTLTDEAFDAFIEDGFTEQADGSVELSCPGPRESLVYRMNPTNDAYLRLDQITCPTTLAAGSATTNIPLELVGPIAAAIPGCRLEWLEGLDHMGPFTHPEVVAASLITALRAPSA